MAQNNPAVLGVKEFQVNLKKSITELGPKVRNGLVVAGLFLQRESQLLVPVDFGVLKASAFTRASGRGLKTVVNVGYTAFYAMYVHENVEMKGKGLPRRPIKFKDDLDWADNPDKWYANRGNYWDPAGRGQAKFLEDPARKLRPQMFTIIQKTILAQGGAGGKKK